VARYLSNGELPLEGGFEDVYEARTPHNEVPLCNFAVLTFLPFRRRLDTYADDELLSYSIRSDAQRERCQSNSRRKMYPGRVAALLGGSPLISTQRVKLRYRSTKW
jgi:hypothetical protein